jgi:hypothetical protein
LIAGFVERFTFWTDRVKVAIVAPRLVEAGVPKLFLNSYYRSACRFTLERKQIPELV